MGAALVFLLATNPVVVEAAGQITSKDIKNETITSKDIKNGQVKGADIKNGSVAKADLAADAVPGATVLQVRRFVGDANTVPKSNDYSFYGPTTTISVGTGQIVVANASVDMFGGSPGDDFYVVLCSRPVGSGGIPTALGDTVSADLDVLVGTSDFSVSRTASGTLPTGSHEIGLCARASTGNSGDVTSYGNASGYAMVLSSGSGALGRVGAPSKKPAGLG